jgi:hypothetical protein
MTWKTTGLALLAMALAAPALAAPAATVEAVQGGAWIERDGKAEALKPGMKVEAKDALRTGEDGRLRMKLAEGSTVKLGSKAHVVIEKAQPGGIFRATLAVTAGAFRFTTDPDRKGEPRDVEIRTLHATAGVRGTDLWGRSAPDRSFIVLIEGRIEVSSAGQPALVLDKPLNYYERVGAAAPAVKVLEAGTLETYARETELRN